MPACICSRQLFTQPLEEQNWRRAEVRRQSQQRKRAAPRDITRNEVIETEGEEENRWQRSNTKDAAINTTAAKESEYFDNTE